MKNKIYPREGDRQTVYLKEVVSDPNIEVGEWTIYNDFAADPVDFERNNVPYHYPVNGDRLVIGKFCSLACGARFLFNSANHSLASLSTYPFPIFHSAAVVAEDPRAYLEERGLPLTKVQIEFDLLPERRAVEARCTVKTSGVTGVEMEALTGVSTALLTIYDMCKAVDKGMELGEIHLVEKTGGKSGHYIRAEGGYV